MAGLPRWAWIGMIAGGVGVGLYLRTRHKEESSATSEETEELPATPQTAASYEGTEAGGGLQALGVAGPVPQATVPVETPRIPEGFPETLGGQGDVISGLAGGIIESQQANDDLVAAMLEHPNKEIIRERMTGHPPKRKPHHKPPRKHPKKEPKTKK